MLTPLATSTTGVVLLGAIYLVLLVTLGIILIRKGHWVMFIIGIFLPIFWIVGAPGWVRRRPGSWSPRSLCV